MAGKKNKMNSTTELSPEGIPSHGMFRTKFNEVVKNIPMGNNISSQIRYFFCF